MSKTITPAMKSHLAQRVTSLTLCWRITRQDGQEFFFTQLDKDIPFAGQTYVAASGFSATAMASEAGFGVSNMDVAGFFDSLAIKEEELRAGLFDYAEVRIFVVNWSDLTMQDVKMLRGRFGEATMSKQGIFTIELRSLTQALQQVIGGFYTPQCDTFLGSTKCKIPIAPADLARSTSYALGAVVRVPDTVPAPDSSAYHDRIFTCTKAGITAGVAPAYDYTVGNPTTDGTAIFTASEAWTRAGIVAAGAQTTAGDRKSINVTLTEPRAVDGWFDRGTLIWESGPNAGKSIEVRKWVQTSAILTLMLSCPYVPVIGDRFRVYPGCDLRGQTCKDKFANKVNFRGFEDIPGQSAITQYGTGGL